MKDEEMVKQIDNESQNSLKRARLIVACYNEVRYVYDM